jgi:hypothetical protein
MTNEKSPTYNIGGVPPYGWSGTPGFNPFQVPNDNETFGEVALYERLDWTNGVNVAPGGPAWLQAGAAKKELQNPPFLGVGSTLAGGSNGRTPGFMGDDAAHRILRGYIRRYDINPASKDNAADAAQSYNSRLYFMWNPEVIERKYAALADLQNFLNLTNSASGPVDNKKTKPYLQTDVGFQLHFDRQEEVSRFKDHPGVLIDLAVFDLLAQGGSPAGQSTTQSLPTDQTDLAPPSQSLAFDPTVMIAVIFSPYLVYFGTLTDVQVTFLKFSHRMTPTRMDVNLSMRLHAFGDLAELRASDQGSVSASASAAAHKASPLGEVDPGLVSAKTDQDKDRLNIQGAVDAMSWGENWMAGRVTPSGVMYDSGAARCAGAEKDSYDNPASNIPSGMDCSSFVSRSFCVIGWGGPLGINPCTDTNGYEAAIKGNPDAWYVYWFGNELARARNNGDSTAAVATVLADQLRPGDCILRSGSGPNGHIAFIHAVLDKGNKYELLHTNKTGTPVHTESYDFQFLLNHYTHLLRAQPIKLVKPDTPPPPPSNPAAQVALAGRL